MDPRPQPVSDEELALQAGAGSRRSFEELMARYGRRLSAFLRPRIGSGQDVEDIIQETFLKLYRNIEHYDPRWKFSTWAYTVAGRLAICHYRNQSKARKIEAAAKAIPEANPEPPVRLAGSNLWETARALPATQYQALWLHYTEELPVKEIARVMGKTSLAVRLLLHRGRLNLASLAGRNEAPAAEAADTPAKTRRTAMPRVKEGWR